MQRRSFLKWAVHGLGALFAAILGIPAVAFLIDPRKRTVQNSDFKTVARLSELQLNVPKQVVISDDRRDAWTLQPNDVVGRVWLVRREGNKVDAYTADCPHLGCPIGFDEKEKLFTCLCHGAKFNLDGKLVTGPKNMRDMDTLDQPANPPEPGLIQVKYRKFILEQPKKAPKV